MTQLGRFVKWIEGLKNGKKAKKIIVGLTLTSTTILPMVASAHLVVPEVKKLECSGKKIQLWPMANQNFELFEYAANVPTKVHAASIKKTMVKGLDIYSAKLSCQSGTLMIVLPVHGSTKSQSLLITNSGRVMDVTPVSRPRPPSRPWWQNWYRR